MLENVIAAKFLMFDQDNQSVDWNDEEVVKTVPASDYRDEVERFGKAVDYLESKLTTIYTSQDVEKEIGVHLYDAARIFDEENLRLFFQRLYQILFNSHNGPRLPTFIEIYGIVEFLDLLYDKLHEDSFNPLNK